MDDEILLPDRRKAIATMITDAVRIAGCVGHEFEVRPVEAGELRHFIERQHPIDLEHAVVCGVERTLHEALQLHRHVGLNIEPDHRAATPTLERGFEQPHQIFRLFEDFQFGVADDPERAHTFDRVAGEQLADEKAGRAFHRNQPHFPPVPRLGQPNEPFDAVGHTDQRIHRLAVLGARELQGDGETKVGNERERVRRIDGERGQQGENVGKKIIFEPRLFRLGDVGAIHEGDTDAAERSAQFAPLRLLILHEKQYSFGDASKLLRRRQSLRALRADAGADLRPQAGDAHHKELVEVVRRDR